MSHGSLMLIRKRTTAVAGQAASVIKDEARRFDQYGDDVHGRDIGGDSSGHCLNVAFSHFFAHLSIDNQLFR